MQANRPREEQIRQRAHEIFLQRGGQPGHAADDWLQAEYELMQLPIRKVAELPASNPRRQSVRKSALVALVHAALLLGTAGMS